MTASGIPRGVFVPSLKMFHVPENKGKTFSNGGFGIALPKDVRSSLSGYNLYLWIEEALFLHDSGLATFVDEDHELLTTQQLYLLLSKGGIQLAVYRVYAHLRNQTYRVLRYAGNNDMAVAFSSQSHHNRDHNRDHHEQRQEQQERNLHLAWRVYNPNANFKKTNPGPPDFIVAVSSFSLPSPTFADILALLRNECQGSIPLKLASVSDSGTVLMFAIADYGVPDRNQKGDVVDEISLQMEQKRGDLDPNK